jgi:hypothetical protein
MTTMKTDDFELDIRVLIPEEASPRLAEQLTPGDTEKCSLSPYTCWETCVTCSWCTFTCDFTCECDTLHPCG